jgi:hypothetical protein
VSVDDGGLAGAVVVGPVGVLDGVAAGVGAWVRVAVGEGVAVADLVADGEDVGRTRTTRPVDDGRGLWCFTGRCAVVTGVAAGDSGASATLMPTAPVKPPAAALAVASTSVVRRCRPP